MADKRLWTKAETFQLIAQFEALPELWDVKFKEYRSRNKKQIALNRLSLAFNTSESEINRKLHNLRTQFHQELRKIRKNNCGNVPEDYECSWEFFGALRFILPDQSDHKIIDTLTSDIKAEKIKTKKINDVLKYAQKFMEKPTDDFQVFGDFVACELRNLRSRDNQNKLKRIIQRAILEMSELEDSNEYNYL